MKRFTLAILIAVLVLGTVATPALAAGITVKATTRPHASSGKIHLDITASMSRASKVTVTVYRGTTRIRTLRPARVSKTVLTAWDLKTATGRYVRPGTYTFVVTATSASGSGRTKVSRWVSKSWLPVAPAATPAPTTTASPTPAPVPAPSSTPTPSAQRFFGAYVKGAPDSMQPVADLEAKVGAKAEFANFFVAITEGFPVNRAAAIQATGATPMVTLEFWDYRLGVNQPAYNLASIARGDHDERIRTFARGAKAYGGTLWVRPLHEMNGNWYPWGGTVNGNSPSQYAPAFRRIVDVMRAEGATNVRFVWCPNNESVPGTAANAINTYYPGDAYVDVNGLDVYNFGTSYSWSTWRSFSSLFGGAYATVTSLSSKPLVICEIGCSTSGGSKAAWISEMFSSLNASFPRVSGLIWFNTNAECDWRVESDTTSLQAFTAGLATF